MASGNGIEVAKAYVTIIPSMEGSQKTITQELTGVTDSAAKEAGEKSGKSFGESLANGLKTTGAVIAGAMAAVTGAAVATGKAFIDASNDVAQLGDTIDKESQKMNMSATGYQEWDFILQHAGTSIEGMKTSMKKLTLAAQEGNEAFDALGISQEELASMSPEEIWNRTISSLQDVTDESTRLNLANSLLGKGAVELAPLFNMTAAETEELKNQVHELGGVMSDEAVKDAAAYQDAMQNMNTALDGLKKNMMSNFLPGITSVMDGLAKVFSGDKSGIGQITDGLKSVITQITALAPQFLELGGSIITSIISGFAPMLPQLVSTIFGVLIQAITTITTMIPQMMPSIISGIEGIMTALFEALPIITQGVFDLILALATWLSQDDTISSMLDGILQMVSIICEQFALLLPVLLPAIVKIISEVAITLTKPENIEMIINAALTIIGAVVVALINAFPEIINLVVGLLENAVGLLTKFVDWIKPFVQNLVKNIMTTVSNWFTNMKNNFTNSLNAIRNTVTNWGNNVKNFFTNLVNAIWNSINNWFTNLKNGFTNALNFIRNSVSTIGNKVRELMNSMINTLRELPSKVIEIGRNLVAGLWNGISDKIQWVKDRIYSMGSQIISAIKGVFGIASPSKVFAGIGEYLAEGLGVGFDDGMSDVRNDIVGSMDNLTGNMTATVSAYGNAAQTLGSTTNYNGGAITINVYGAEGQNVNELAEKVANKLGEMTQRRGAIYA